LPVSRLGLGLAALGRPGYINLGHGDDLGAQKDVATSSARRTPSSTPRTTADPLLRRRPLVRQGGGVPRLLARAARLGPGTVTVGSKWGYTYTAGWRVDAEVHEVKDLSLATLRGSSPRAEPCSASSPPLPDPLGDARERRARGPGVLDELARLRETGLAIG
jgi:hypothetical protein